MEDTYRDIIQKHLDIIKEKLTHLLLIKDGVTSCVLVDDQKIQETVDIIISLCNELKQYKQNNQNNIV